MKRPILFLLLSIVVLGVVKAQVPKELEAGIEKINRYETAIDTLSPLEDEGDFIMVYNDSLIEELTAFLKNKNLLKYNYDSIFAHLTIGKNHSADKKFWVFNWYANNGGSWHVINEILFAVLPGNHAFVSDMAETVGTDTIYTFKTKKGNVYLAQLSGITCNTCIVSMAQAWEINDSALTQKEGFFGGTESGITLDARSDDIKEFGYNPKTKKFAVSYIVDDQNAGEGNAQGDKIKYEYYFNGENFELVKKKK